MILLPLDAEENNMLGVYEQAALFETCVLCGGINTDVISGTSLRSSTNAAKPTMSTSSSIDCSGLFVLPIAMDCCCNVTVHLVQQ
jgi:hypothetical protein